MAQPKIFNPSQEGVNDNFPLSMKKADNSTKAMNNLKAGTKKNRLEPLPQESPAKGDSVRVKNSLKP